MIFENFPSLDNASSLAAIFTLSLIVNTSFSQDTLFKALYVDDFIDIIDIPTQEEKLLEYAKENGFNYLVINNISKIHRNRFPLDNQMTDDPFANFIRIAKTEYGIKRISVVGETAASFEPIIKYNDNHKENLNEQVDGFNLTLEFWNSRLIDFEKYYCKTYFKDLGLPCNRKGAFFFYLTQIKDLRAITSEKNLRLESFVGNATKDEMQELVQYINTIHVHYYRKKIKNLAKFKTERLDAIIDGASNVEVFPLFSSGEKYFGPWLKDHQSEDVFPIYMEQLKENESLLPILKNIKGYGWGPYSKMPK